jgi:hypothetical protein
MKVKEINIFEQVGGPAAVSTEDGQHLFEGIHALLEKDAVVSLNFVNIETMTSTFLNAAIGQLYSHYDSPFLQKHLKVKNLTPEDRDIVKRVVERAKQYFKDKENIENPVREAMDGQ